MKNLAVFISTILLLCTTYATNANNLLINNISVPSTTTIEFDIAWDNSWNITGVSYDAVWVFVKAQNCAGATNYFDHADVSIVDADHSVTGGVLQVDAVTDGKGVFIRRTTAGFTGDIATATVTLTFSSAHVTANTNFEVFGIEMVNVAQGLFTIGDASTLQTQSSNSYKVTSISSEAGLASDALRLDKAGDGARTAHSAIPAAYPKGFDEFYSMKYEVSQAQYVSFLNLLDFGQQTTRTAVTPASAVGTLALTDAGNANRNSIEISTAGSLATPAVYGNDLSGNNTYNEAADGGDIACNFLSWNDLSAYLDWAALRPMSEFEFTKAARGGGAPILIEYPWGSTTINQAISSSLTNSGQSSEVSTSTSDGLSAHNGGASTTLGPLRVGFAATAITGRTGAGASFYGIMNLGGNVWEQTYWGGYFSSPTRFGSTFTGVLGDGAIDASGNADATNWGGVSESVVRGGSWESVIQEVQTSDRTYINSTAENSSRNRRTGGRGVRQI